MLNATSWKNSRALEDFCGFNTDKMASFILTLSGPDRPGIVHAVTAFLVNNNLNIIDSSQYGDSVSKRFFMRTQFVQASEADETPELDTLCTLFKSTANDFSLDFEINYSVKKPRVLIMVSKIGHCLNDLLFRQSTGQLSIEIPLIVSNHPDFATLAATYNIPFHHLPVTADTKAQQEAEILRLVDENKIELIVLARYMQVLSPTLCSAMSGRIINIHHSFLPSLKGAKP